jgi:osmotically-inducible protein OsmY
MFTGCQRVDNLIEIVPPERDNDAELNDAVLMTLEKDPGIDAGAIRVTTHDGIVELDGQLTNSEQKQLIARDTWLVPDVKDVHNNIYVLPR